MVSVIFEVCELVEDLGNVHRLIFWKHKNTKTYLSCQQIPEKYSTPSTGTKCKNIPLLRQDKTGRLQKGSASTANPKKEHHHGEAIHLV
jgi:hypothetical protein